MTRTLLWITWNPSISRLGISFCWTFKRHSLLCRNFTFSFVSTSNNLCWICRFKVWGKRNVHCIYDNALSLWEFQLTQKYPSVSCQGNFGLNYASVREKMTLWGNNLLFIYVCMYVAYKMHRSVDRTDRTVLTRFKIQDSVYLPFYLIYQSFINISMYGEVTPRNHQAYSWGHLAHSNMIR